MFSRMLEEIRDFDRIRRDDVREAVAWAALVLGLARDGVARAAKVFWSFFGGFSSSAGL